MLSNLVNSGFQRIKVLTQYRATSLVRHLARAWTLASTVVDEFIEPVPAAMNLGPTWFRGTADAIWQNLDLLRDVKPVDVLVFGSDHVYKMDIAQMLEFHRGMGADLTVATLRVPRSEARSFGCVHVDASGWVRGFVEKPENPPAIPGDPDTRWSRWATTSSAPARCSRSCVATPSRRTPATTSAATSSASRTSA